MKPIRFLPKIQKGSVCLNCDKPLDNAENFCPACGQKNDIQKLNFGHFLHTVFSDVISYDSRLWRTISALLFHPGKVSKDYVEGKRAQYSNPFRFYLTISIVFFLLLGAINKYEDFKNNGFSTAKILKMNQPKKMNLAPVIDSITSVNSIVDSLAKNEIKKDNFNIKLDTTSNLKKLTKISKKISQFGKFYIKHQDLPVDVALDSMQQPHNFWNRFYYSKIIDAVEIANDHGKSFNKKLISNLSMALFFFLPLFALFLKLFYLRGSFNYMEHLVFVFNTQSVFFLLMMLVTGLNFFSQSPSITAIFVGLFLIYLYLALLKFYGQGRFKTFIKFTILNLVYLILSTIGLSIISVFAFLIG